MHDSDLTQTQRGDEHIQFIIKKYDLDLLCGGAHFDKQFWNSKAAAEGAEGAAAEVVGEVSEGWIDGAEEKIFGKCCENS